MRKLYGLDLFSGIGGLSLSISQWVKTIAYCENDRHARAVLLDRMSDGRLERAPIWDDIKSLRGTDIPRTDIIFGGFPCQDISVAGLGKGLEGERSGLFYEVCRLVKEIQPSFIFLENVPAIRTRGLREVIRELTDLRYDCRWTCVSASEVGAPHIRKRWFLLGYSQHNGSHGTKIGRSNGKTFNPRSKEREIQTREFERASGKSEVLANTNRKRRKFEHGRRSGKEYGEIQTEFRLHGETQLLANTNRKHDKSKELKTFKCSDWWKTEPSVGRVVDELPLRMDRLKRLGNAVVPIQAEVAFRRLLGDLI